MNKFYIDDIITFVERYGYKEDAPHIKRTVTEHYGELDEETVICIINDLLDAPKSPINDLNDERLAVVADMPHDAKQQYADMYNKHYEFVSKLIERFNAVKDLDDMFIVEIIPNDYFDFNVSEQDRDMSNIIAHRFIIGAKSENMEVA